MVRVLFVCLGNICRSPMGEFILKNKVIQLKCSDQFEIASAGTSNEEEGNPVYYAAREELAQHAISCAGKRARQLVSADYTKYDYILCMEQRNKSSAMRIFGGDSLGKVFCLLDFSENPSDIADPWYTRDFTGVYNQINSGIESFLRYLKTIGEITY